MRLCGGSALFEYVCIFLYVLSASLCVSGLLVTLRTAGGMFFAKHSACSFMCIGNSVVFRKKCWN